MPILMSQISINMTYTFVENPSEDKDKFLTFCKNAYNQSKRLSGSNMWDPDWENTNSTLPYLMYKTDRFSGSNGIMYGLRTGDELIAVSGIYISSFDKNVAIAGVRSWINEGHRANLVIGKHLLPQQLAWAKAAGIRAVALTFNDYNRPLMTYFTRAGLGVIKRRTSDMMFYNGVHEVPFPVVIQHTKQWAIYHKIDETYTPDWESIKCLE
jgi:hypothetical protein